MCYVTGFLPNSIKQDPSTFALRTCLLALRFQDPTNPLQAKFSSTFAPLVKNLPLNASNVLNLDLPYTSLTEITDGFFPYGFRRGFWGGQVSNISTSYLADITGDFGSYIEDIIARGEAPASALWCLQYMFPGLNGNLPASDNDTAWPHRHAGHRTLFSPAWSLTQEDSATYTANDMLNALTYAQQLRTGPTLADYPNYISPNVSASRVWGDNVGRLVKVKQKYDPYCRIHNGRVFASPGCIARGWANLFN